MDIDLMLRREAYLLFKDAQSIPAKFFVKLAEMESLRQEDWTYFWKLIRGEK